MANSESQINGAPPSHATGTKLTRDVMGNLNYRPKSGAGLVETLIRICSTLLCIGILITGSVAFTGIDLAEDNGDYPNGDSHRGVAGWTVFLGSAGIIYNCVILYSFFCHLNFVVQRHFKGYVYINGIICLIFVPAMLAGGIVNAVYTSDNSTFRDENCFGIPEDGLRAYCRGDSRVFGCEVAGAVLSFLAMVCFGLLVIVMLYNVYKISKEPIQNNGVPLQLKIAPSSRLSS